MRDVSQGARNQALRPSLLTRPLLARHVLRYPRALISSLSAGPPPAKPPNAPPTPQTKHKKTPNKTKEKKQQKKKHTQKKQEKQK